jgi:hypothetical protein
VDNFPRVKLRNGLTDWAYATARPARKTTVQMFAAWNSNNFAVEGRMKCTGFCTGWFSHFDNLIWQFLLFFFLFQAVKREKVLTPR